MQPLDLIDAAPWERVVFTTYALSLSFFEAVILDRLVRGGARNALILSDPEGVRAGLSERGAARVGREYEVEPIACHTGVFHPKVSLFSTADDCHMLVGSGNLTFGGWGANLEVVEHLHPSFAADAFIDAADMFESMVITDRLRHGVAVQLEALAQDLRRFAAPYPNTGAIRLLHSLDRPIADDLAQFAADLGGATRLTVVSPYFDKNGSAVTALAERLGCDDVRVHVHAAGAVRGSAGLNWPTRSPVNPVQIEGTLARDNRRLHAKCFEIMCRNGRLIVSGSANATRAALITGNVETSIVRIQREVTLSWAGKAVKAPTLLADVEDADDSAQNNVGILRASLDGDQIKGSVIVPLLSGAARIGVVAPAAIQDLGPVVLDESGSFAVAAPGLESLSWTGGRMVLRVEQDGVAAEGFVSVAAAAEIMRRAGPLAPRILAMLSGTETPADLAAIMSWFKEDPRRLLTPAIGWSGSGGHQSDSGPIWVPLDSLTGNSMTAASATHTRTSTEPAWERALALLKAGFTRRPGPWKSGTAEDDDAQEEGSGEEESERSRRLARQAREEQKAYAAFLDLLDTMLAPAHGGQHVRTAFALGHYLVDRLRPEPSLVRPWLQRIINAASALESMRDADIVTAALLLCATDDRGDPTLRTRRFLRRCELDPDSAIIDASLIPGFVGVFAPDWTGAELLVAARSIRTPGEQVQAYLAAASDDAARDQFPLLMESPFARRLVEALNDPAKRARLRIVSGRPRACPQCHIELDGRAVDHLRAFGVAACCRLILDRGA